MAIIERVTAGGLTVHHHVGRGITEETLTLLDHMMDLAAHQAMREEDKAQMGGKPNPGTKPDRRLKENKRKPKSGSKGPRGSKLPKG